MKKSIILLACVLAMGAASAQEKKGGLEIEIGGGTTRYGGFSPVSAFTDPTESYGLIPTEHMSVGYRENTGWFIGITLNHDAGHTAFQNLNEKFMNLNALVDVRHYAMLSDRFELMLGAAVGLLVHNNTFDFGNTDHSFTRYGFGGHFSTGLNYVIDEHTYIGIQASFPCIGSFMGKAPTLPGGLTATSHNQLVGYGLQVTYGLRF